MMLDVQTLSGMGALGGVTVQQCDAALANVMSWKRFVPGLTAMDNVTIARCWVDQRPWAYEKAMYGNIPTPDGTKLPTPIAPTTVPQLTQPGAWTPEQTTSPDAYKRYSDALRKRIADAEADGSYNPEGSLPVTADDIAKAKEAADAAANFLGDNKTLLVIGAAVAAGVVLMLALKR